MAQRAPCGDECRYSSPFSLGVTAHSQVGVLGVWYKSVNSGAEERPGVSHCACVEWDKATSDHPNLTDQ